MHLHARIHRSYLDAVGKYVVSAFRISFRTPAPQGSTRTIQGYDQRPILKNMYFAPSLMHPAVLLERSPRTE